jgi:hypothetical protein
LVKKTLEKKSCGLTHKSKSTSGNCLALREMPFFQQKHQHFGQKTLGRKKLRLDPISLNPLSEII